MTEQEELDYEMKPEYDISNARPNPYIERLLRNEQMTVRIEPELYARFPGSEAVNEALRSFLKLREQEAT